MVERHHELYGDDSSFIIRHSSFVILWFFTFHSFTFHFPRELGSLRFAKNFPTVASRKVNDEIQKRPVWEYLSQEEYDRREAEGTLDENT